MRNVHMIRMEPDLVWIPLERAVLCKNCHTISTSTTRRCGLCGSEHINRFAMDDPDPPETGPASSVALAA
jgi:hypothetical protein